MTALICSLIVFGAGAAGFLFARSAIRLRFQLIVGLLMAVCWIVACTLDSPSIHNRKLDLFPSFIKSLIQFSADASAIGLFCGAIGWAGGTCLRVHERRKKPSDKTLSK
jgi:hypothetical protein